MDSIKIHVSGEKWMGKDGFAGESLWAVRLTSNTAKVDNVPFFTYGLSLNDVVLLDEDNEVISVVEPSGLKNIRVIVPPSRMDDVEGIIAGIKSFGGDVEGYGGGVMLAITITKNLLARFTEWLDSENLAWENGN